MFLIVYLLAGVGSLCISFYLCYKTLQSEKITKEKTFFLGITFLSGIVLLTLADPANIDTEVMLHGYGVKIVRASDKFSYEIESKFRELEGRLQLLAEQLKNVSVQQAYFDQQVKNSINNSTNQHINAYAPQVRPDFATPQSISVIYRDGHEQLAKDILDNLLASGFAATTVNSNLAEILPYLEKDEPDSVHIAIKNLAPENVEKIRRIVKISSKASTPLNVKESSGWKFKYNAAEIFLL